VSLRLAAALSLLAAPLFAQDFAEAPGAKLRMLDKLTGEVSDLLLSNGETKTVGYMTVKLDSCRSPADNATAEAYAHLTLLDSRTSDTVFSGWMVASSPALSALDHPRYDVWVLRCDVPDLVLPEVEPAPEEDPAPEAEATPADDGQ